MSVAKIVLRLLQLVLAVRMASGSCLCLSVGCAMCSPATSDSVSANLDFCGITDADLPVVDECLTQIGRDKIGRIYLNENSQLTTLTEDLFREMPALTSLNLDETAMASLPSGLFADTPSLTHIYLQLNDLESLPSGFLDGATSLEYLDLSMNSITELPSGLFDSTLSLTNIVLSENQLTTFPAGLLEDLGRVENLPSGASALTVSLWDNPDLQCTPSTCAACSVVIDVDDSFTGGTCDDGTTPPTPSPTDSGGGVIISCDLWECGVGYTNVERDCSTQPSYYGRRLQATQDYVDNDFYTTDGYTTLGNYPICSQVACCDQTPTPAPTPAPTAPDGIVSCDLWECGAGYTNVERECSTHPSPYGRRLQATQDYVDNDFYTSDGYTTLGNYPICSQEACCDQAPTPSPTPAPTIAPTATGGTTCGTTTIEGILGTNDSGSVCCPSGCTKCGGTGCGNVGAAQGLGNTDCCVNGVLRSQDLCSSSGAAPCVVDRGATCASAGVEGILGTNGKGSVCCPLGCAKCGGSGCSKIGEEEGLDGTDCCINGVLESQGLCSSTGVAPCVLF